MMREDCICNGFISDALWEKIEQSLPFEEKVLFVVTADFNLNSRYGEAALVVTDSLLLCVENSTNSEGFSIYIKDIEKINVRRMYGNAALYIDDKKRLRFSFASIAAMEAVAQYVKSVNDGQDKEHAAEIVKTVIEKQKRFCPKCGRSLLYPGAECTNCQGKGKMYKRLWYYIKPQSWRLIVCVLFSVITTAMALVPPYITKLLVDDVIPNSDLKLLYTLVVVLLVVHLLQAVVGTFRHRVMRRASDSIVTNLRDDVFEKAQYLTVDFYDKIGSGSIYSRISGDTSTLNMFMLRISQEAVVQFFTMIGIVVIMFSLNWKLALLSLLPIPVVVAGSRIFRLKIRPLYHRLWIRWSAVCDVVSDALPGIRVTKAFTGEEDSIDNFKRHTRSWFNVSRKAANLGSVFPHAVTFFITCGSLAIWGIGGTWTINNPTIMSAGLLVSFISYASMFYNPVNFFANLSDSYSNALTSAERLMDILDAEPEEDNGKGNLVDGFKGKIEFKNVSFSFDKTVKTLDNINLTIEPGDVIGVVGTTGAGKSTLINLILRYYNKYEGQILVDGQNIKDIDLKSYRAQIGFVQQEPIMFRKSIFRNIALSDPKATVEDVIKAAEVANAHGFITHLPDGYDTMLGERGVGLSGGERQRLSIARAVMKNPSILIFDEATASVDSETEHLIQEAIERLISGRTTIMIAHRLSTLRRANKIIVMEKGKIIETGSHEELLAKKGKYFKLVEIQNLSDEIRRKESDRKQGDE